jgi:hypothetical protein
LSVFQSSLVRFALVRFSICTGPVLHLSDFTKAENSSVFTKAENWSELACPICPILPRLRTRQFLPGLRTCPNLLVLLSDFTKAENSSVFTRAENLSGFPKGENLSVLPKAEDLSVFLKAEGVFDFQVWDIGQVIVSNFDWLPFTPLVAFFDPSAFNLFSGGRKLFWRQCLTQSLRLTLMCMIDNYTSEGFFVLLALVLNDFVRDAGHT